MSNQIENTKICVRQFKDPEAEDQICIEFRKMAGSSLRFVKHLEDLKKALGGAIL